MAVCKTCSLENLEYWCLYKICVVKILDQSAASIIHEVFPFHHLVCTTDHRFVVVVCVSTNSLHMSANLSTRLQFVYERIDRHKSGLKVMVLEHMAAATSRKRNDLQEENISNNGDEKIFKAASECSGAIDNE